jgi:trans-aconitate 2-methyltransferase
MRQDAAMSDTFADRTTDYAYGDDSNALERLQLLAAVFRPVSDTLLQGLSTKQPTVVLDLGCGPGETTRLLQEHFPGATTIGLDASDEFVRAARERQPMDIRFEVEDVKNVPIMGAPADLIYARFLLAHLTEPVGLIADWSRQLRPGGLLVSEEVEDIKTEDPLFESYLRIATAPLHARETELCIGPTLSAMPPPSGTAVHHCGTARLQPTIKDVAAMFSLNLQTLRRDEAIVSGYAKEELDDVASALAARSRDDSAGAITWEIRQLVLQRNE